jgi:protein SCO1
MRPSLRLALLALTATLALAVALIVAFGGPSSNSSRTSSSPAAETLPSSGYYGALLPANLPPHDFTLSDQDGRRVDLRDHRGQVVILTFLSATATGASPLIAQQIRGALDDLDHPASALAVSTDPTADTPARVRRFLRAAFLIGRMEYLTGTFAQLRPIWRAYHVIPALAGRHASERAASVLLIDPQGRERVIFALEQLTPEALAHDIGKLQNG